MHKGRILLKLATLLINVLAGPLSVTQLRGQEDSANESKPVISSAKDLLQYATQIRRKSRVPPRIPNFLPYLSGGDSVFLASAKVDTSGYLLELGFEPGCQGEHRCFYGSFRGSVVPIDSPDEKPVAVKLMNGIRAHFYPPSIGAYCSDSSVIWAERGYFYAIEMKCESRRMLQKLANSAIHARH